MSPPKCGAPGNCPVCPPLKPALPTRYPSSIREKREWPPPITPKPWNIRRPPE